MSVDGIVAKWNDKGKEAANKGTILHEQIENYYLGYEYNPTEEFLLFEDFATDHSFIAHYRFEWRIFDEEYGENENMEDIYEVGSDKKITEILRIKTVSYTHLTLPTKGIV